VASACPLSRVLLPGEATFTSSQNDPTWASSCPLPYAAVTYVSIDDGSRDFMLCFLSPSLLVLFQGARILDRSSSTSTRVLPISALFSHSPCHLLLIIVVFCLLKLPIATGTASVSKHESSASSRSSAQATVPSKGALFVGPGSGSNSLWSHGRFPFGLMWKRLQLSLGACRART
jgi:hypothetical protein